MFKLSKSVIGIFILMIAAAAWSSPVPDTGVTKCYNAATEITCPTPGQPFYGQDASYAINPMSYTKLDAAGNALPDSAVSWTMVKDKITGLYWEMKTNKDGVKNYTDPHDADNTYSWYDSNPATNGGYAGWAGDGTDTEDFIKALNDAKYGGFSDWRMPTIKELAYIVNDSILDPGPTINTDYFPNTATWWYWSSTTYANTTYPSNTSNAWAMHFSYGLDDIGSKRGESYVRAVRGGQSGLLGDLVIGSFDSWGAAQIDDADAAGSFTDNKDGTVTDTSTGLMWRKEGSWNEMTWEQALWYCEYMDFAGYTDWRLPTIKELRSLVDYSRYNPAIDTNYFPNAAASCYWSSTTYANITNGAWQIVFDDGRDYYYDKNYRFYARAVRGGQSGLLGNLVISPTSRSVTKEAGTTTFNVSNTGTMPWTATVTSSGGWLRITSGSSGNNAGTITCGYDANTAATTRTGTIRVTAPNASGSPKNVTVTQAGYNLSTIPDTGVTKCYNADTEITCPTPGQPFYGQDASYTVNPMSYTKLDAAGNALPDSAASWTMVKDKITDLYWEMKTNKDGVKNYTDPHDADNTYSWYDSNPATNGCYAGTPGDGTDTEDFIKQMNDKAYGGYTDWRMPTITELGTIVKHSIPAPGPTIDTKYFPNTQDWQGAWYWSSSTDAGNNLLAWIENFSEGLDAFGSKPAASHYVRAVRSGQSGALKKESNSVTEAGSIAAGKYVDNEDGTVTDTTTGLMWQQIGPETEMTWKESLAYCEKLELGAHSDWRLPTIKELISLVDYSRYSPAINTTFFPNTAALWYWSSTTYASSIGYALTVYFYNGQDDFGGKPAQSRYVRAVRGGQVDKPALTVSPSSRQVAKEAGSTAFSVSNSGTGTMPWTAAVTSGGTWLTVSSGASGTNSGTITCGFTANTAATTRTGTIRVTAPGATGSPKDVMVTQAASPAPVTISGSVKTGSGTAISGVTITFSNGGGTVTTDAGGNYSKSVLYGYSGTTTPSKTGYTFSPASKTYSAITTNQTGQNFTGTPPYSANQQCLAVWSDGVWVWDKTTGKWTLIPSTKDVTMIAAGKVDTDNIDDLIGVWPSGFYLRQSSNGQWIKLSTSLPTWIATGDLNNDKRDDVIATWAGDGAYYRDSAAGKWTKVSSPAKQLAAGNIGGVRDDLAGLFSDGLWIRYSVDSSWKHIDAWIPLWMTVGDMTGDKRADIVVSYSTATWVRNSATGGWIKLSSSASQLAAGDMDGDGRDDLVGIWSGSIWVFYPATGQWQEISKSKPSWIATGKMIEAILAAGSLEDPAEMEDVVDQSKERIDVNREDEP